MVLVEKRILYSSLSKMRHKDHVILLLHEDNLPIQQTLHKQRIP